jgi:hypothetical protein
MVNIGDFDEIETEFGDFYDFDDFDEFDGKFAELTRFESGHATDDTNAIYLS